MTLRTLSALCLTLTVLNAATLPALAAPPTVPQTAPATFDIMALASDARTLSGGGMTVVLWGVDPATPAGTLENLHARVALDDLIAGNPVHCTPMQPPANGVIRAQCLNGQERDLGLTLVTAGLVAVNRHDTQGSPLANAYIDAETKARAGRMGIWGNAATASAQTAQSAGLSLPGLPFALPVWALALVFLAVPVVGLMLVAMVMNRGFKQLVTLQKFQLSGTQKRERQLKEREKHVIASALEGEINANRAKLDAFLVIYEEMLKSLRDPSKKPKYQRGGDIIHEKPALARTVYDAHIDKIEVLGPQITTELANLYGMIDPAPVYKTLEPEMPIEKVRELIDRIVRNATKMADPMDRTLGALSIIVRDKRNAA